MDLRAGSRERDRRDVDGGIEALLFRFLASLEDSVLSIAAMGGKGYVNVLGRTE